MIYIEFENIHQYGRYEQQCALHMHRMKEKRLILNWPLAINKITIIGTSTLPFFSAEHRAGFGRRISLQGVVSPILQTSHIVIKLLKALTTC